MDDFEIVHVSKKVETEKGYGDSGNTSIEDLYDRYTQLIFVVDNSASMAAGMAPDDEVKQYAWTAELLQQFRDAMKRLNEENEAAEKESSDDPDDEDGEDNGFISYAIPEDDERLKKMVVEQQLMRELNINVPKNSYMQTYLGTQSKIDAVKVAAKTFVNERFDKYPEANVMLVEFERKSKCTSGGQTREGVLAAIEQLDASEGFTYIVNAVDDTLNRLKKHPKGLGSHHIVLVTDGFDQSDRLMTDLLPRMKELGVVLDFIFIIGASDGIFDFAMSKVEAIKTVCKETGGDYKEVRTSKDFQKQFAEAANRKCLPLWKG